MQQLQDLAQLVRTKNAGPRRITLHVIFHSDADYQRVTQSKALVAEKMAPLYGVSADAVTVINYPIGRAIKIVVPRQFFLFQAEDGIRDLTVTGVQSVLFRSHAAGTAGGDGGLQQAALRFREGG